MHAKSFAHSIQRGLWVLTTLLTALLAGFLTSHSVMLGRYFTWIIQTGHYPIFAETFPLFRAASQANVHYNLFLYASIIIGILWTVSCFIVRKDRVVALIAGLSTFWVGGAFFASGFSEAEEAVSTGAADAAVQQFFVSLNLPLHTSFAVFYTICFLLLLWAGCRNQGQEPHTLDV
ncbi:MAG: hypothetical protein JXA97_11140 [Anaerolineales bacterium]|nr:hypothetical protein [Anaerolineales bacterium]